MWTNSYTDKLDWQFKRGLTQTKDTGPSRDHTNGLGTVLNSLLFLYRLPFFLCPCLSSLFPFTLFLFSSGHYLYVESSGATAGQTADLVSPWIAAKSGGQCLKLYYTMYGKTMGSLSIKLELSNGISWLIFYKKGNQGMDWKKGTGNIDLSLNLSYRVCLSSTLSLVIHMRTERLFVKCFLHILTYIFGVSYIVHFWWAVTIYERLDFKF